jgi:hypothetical protein
LAITLALGYRNLHAPRFVPLETFERARLTRPFLQRLIDYGTATGYLRGRSVQRTSG